MIDKRKITVEISIEDMGRISIALDSNKTMYAGSPEWSILQRKWDRMYRGVHAALETGVKAINV